MVGVTIQDKRNLKQIQIAYLEECGYKILILILL